MNADSDMEILGEFKAKLLEHFDTVQIFVTREKGEDSSTVNAHCGGGNWFARYGQVRNWMVQADEETREKVRG